MDSPINYGFIFGLGKKGTIKKIPLRKTVDIFFELWYRIFSWFKLKLGKVKLVIRQWLN